MPVLAVTCLYGALVSLWCPLFRPQSPPASRPFGRGIPVYSAHSPRELKELSITLDGSSVNLAANAVMQDPTRQLELRQRTSERSLQLFGYRPVALVNPSDGPRPGDWAAEEHWATARWRTASGDWQERALNLSEVMAYAGQDGVGQIEFVLLDLWPSIPRSNPGVLTWVICGVLASTSVLVIGFCTYELPRALLMKSLAAALLGPFWPVWVCLARWGPSLSPPSGKGGVKDA
jgi:hypothetical protein